MSGNCGRGAIYEGTNWQRYTDICNSKNGEKAEVNSKAAEGETCLELG